MPKLITKTALAKMCGVSKPAISQAIQKGLVKTTGKGRAEKVVLDHHITQEYINTPRENRKNSGVTAAPKPETPPTITAPPAKDDEPPVLMLSDIDDVNEKNIHLLEKRDIDKLKVMVQTKEANLKLQERRGQLINRELVRRVFVKLYSIDTNELKTLEDRITPEICGYFDKTDDSEEASQIRKAINDEITKTLRHIKRQLNDFLKTQNAEAIR